MSYRVRALRQASQIITGIGLIAVLASCGGSDSKSDNPPPPPPNQAPVANAGTDVTVAELSTVNLDGSATTDANGNSGLTYSWRETSNNAAITITNPNSLQATFTAPDVVFGSPEQFEFELLVSDGSLTSTDTVVITVQEPGPDVVVSGTAEYEFVPANNNCQGLAFPSTQPQPIRGATIQAIEAGTSNVLATSVTDANGDYALTVPSQMNIFLRVRAELKRTGIPSWDVEVRDNTSNINLPLSQRPLYVLDVPAFDTGGVSSTQDILATTGWDSGAGIYTGTRAAAPFSVLDTIYNGIQLVLSVDSDSVFESLDAYWSVNNTVGSNSQNSSDDINNGQLTGSFYRGGDSLPGQLFLLGDASTDTEEFDVNVTAHEWGHYFEDKFSRSDSQGGPHSLGNRLDMRLAFGEGWGTAIGAMATGNPQYCDTGAAGSTNGFGFNIEQTLTPEPGIIGWFNELTIARFLYDLWDTNVDGVDNDSMGFEPIYLVMANQQANTEALTSIFSFATELKNNNPGFTTFIDALLDNADINSSLTIYADNEDNDADGQPLLQTRLDVLPVYHDLVPDGSVVNVCSNSQFDNSRHGNKLSEYQYLRFDVTSSNNYVINITNSNPWVNPPVGFNCTQAFNANPNDPEVHRYSDPDFLVFQNGNLVAGNAGCTPNTETDTAFLTSGTHIISLTEFRFADDQTVSGHPTRVCFDVSVMRQ